MKKTILFSAALATLGTFAAAAQAEELGRVISTTPVMQQVGVPRQVCNNAQVITPTGPTGAGAVMGGIAGAALGNGVGHGSGRAAATALGLLGGAVLGNNIEGNRASQVQNVQQCSTQTYYENRTVAYNVAYEYAGKQYNVQMPQDPGPYIRLQVTPTGGNTQQMAPLSQAQPGGGYSQADTQPTYVERAVVYGASPVVYSQPYYAAPAYASPYYAAPIGLSLNLGYSNFGGGYGGGGHHGRWR